MQPGMPQGFGVIGAGPDPDLHAARQPGERVRVVPAVRPARPGRPAGHRTCRPGRPVRAIADRRRCARRRAGGRFLRGVLDAAAGTVTPLTGQGSHQLGGAGPGQRADRRARAGASGLEEGDTGRRTVRCHDRRPGAAHATSTRPGTRGWSTSRPRTSRAREARASGRVLLSAEAVAALRDRPVPKGDALAVARIAGIQGAKRTPDLVPAVPPDRHARGHRRPARDGRRRRDHGDGAHRGPDRGRDGGADLRSPSPRSR